MLNQSLLQAQYTENFELPVTNDKGVLAGTCSGSDGTTCTINDFGGVNWSINGNLSMIAAGGEDFAKTIGGVMTFEDVDEEVCWESPILDISAVAGTFSISADVGWVGFDDADYIDVEYQVDGGVWNQVPNQLGGGTHTIQFNPASNNTGNTSVSEGGISGVATASIRVCGDINLGTIGGTLFEQITVDNVSVPEAGAVVLPVRWAEVKVQSLKEGNQLNWATYTEINNDRFEIEKSEGNNGDFRKIGTVEGAGYSLNVNRYEFLDTEINNSDSYYRIKQVDFDGNFEYSQIVLARTPMKDRIRFAPNPFSSQILISMNQEDLIDNTAIRMYDNFGQLVMQRQISSLNLDDPIETSHLPAGMYTIQFSNNEVVRMVKF